MQGHCITHGLAQLQAVWDNVPSEKLLRRLGKYRWTGRPGYSLAALWRAYLASFVLNLPHTNALIRRLEDDPVLREECGFDDPLPSRWTFNRFIIRLADHQDLVDECLAALTDELASLLPGFGEKVVVDSTTVRSHSNPNRKVVSDPEASWTAKNSARAKKNGKEWHFGYKYHAIVDATYGLPITGFTTTASRNDSPELPNLFKKAKSTYDWFSPTHGIGDKGYDATSNHRCIAFDYGAIPIIHIRSLPKKALQQGIYTDEGVPTCLGLVPMEYVRSDPEKGHLYRCRREGCHLRFRKGVHYCNDEVWQDPNVDLRLFGPIRRGSKEWKDLYSLRQAIERVFKGMKESRRLERHCVRGLRKIGLHATMSVLAFQATALVHVLAGEVEDMRWMVRKVA